MALSSPVTPAHAEKSGAVPVSSEVVSSASGASVSVGSVDSQSEPAAEGLGVGLPRTPPVAALAIVPAAMSTAHAVGRTLNGFIDSVWPDDPAKALAKRLFRKAAPGDDASRKNEIEGSLCGTRPRVRLGSSLFPRGGRHGLAGCARAAVECDPLPQDVRVLVGEPERRAARRDEQRRLDGGLQRRPRPGGAGDRARSRIDPGERGSGRPWFGRRGGLLHLLGKGAGPRV